MAHKLPIKRVEPEVFNLHAFCAKRLEILIRLAQSALGLDRYCLLFFRGETRNRVTHLIVHFDIAAECMHQLRHRFTNRWTNFRGNTNVSRRRVTSGNGGESGVDKAHCSEQNSYEM